MDAKECELREYLKEDGSNPFQEWLSALKDVPTRARIRVRLNRIRTGNLGDCRSLGDGVHEFKISFGPGYRVYFGNDGPTVVLLLCAGEKKRQSRDIETAKRYWLDYCRRKVT